jgi:hypothetical protein
MNEKNHEQEPNERSGNQNSNPGGTLPFQKIWIICRKGREEWTRQILSEGSLVATDWVSSVI